MVLREVFKLPGIARDWRAGCSIVVATGSSLEAWVLRGYNRRLGEVAQLGERRVRNAEVGSSILLFSTKNSSLVQ